MQLLGKAFHFDDTLLYPHFEPQMGIHGMHNPPPDEEARRRP